MQNSPPEAGAMPTVNLSSWEPGPDGHFAPRNAGSDSGHDLITRRRNAQTCEMCSRKKTKCEFEGSNTSCTQCMRRNTRCKFTTRREKRENLKRSQYVKELEERVRKTESLLRAAGLFDEESFSHDEFDGEGEKFESDSEHENESGNENISRPSNWGTAADHGRTRRHASTGHNLGTVPMAEKNSSRNSCPSFGPNSSPDLYERRRSSPGSSNIQHVPVLKIDDREESRYYGRSSSLSILSREGIEWIKKKAGDVRFLNLLTSDSSHDSPWGYWRPDVFHDLFSSQVFKSLPPRAEVFSLLKDYFRTVNRLFPLYHEGTFMRLVEWQYTQQTCDDAARWASINILISLAYEYRFSNSLKPERDREKAWLYFKNAMSVFAELTLRRTDLLSVQALLGMALFLRGNSGTQSALPIITAAMRACHRMGLHRNLPRPYLSSVEQEQRKRVFWIAYILDQSTCIRSGSAPVQHIDDFDVDLPAEPVDDDCIMGDHKTFFRRLCRLTIIKGRICCKLYTTKALNDKSITEIFRIVDELHAELEEWKKHSVFDVQLKLKPAGEDFLFGFATAGLRFVYYNSLIMIHRIPLIVHFIHARYIPPERQKTSDLRRIANQSSTSAMICVQAARDTLKLVNNLPWGDIAWIWSLLYYVFLAVISIFAHILQDSSHPKAKEDVNLLNIASTFLGTLVPGDGPCRYARFMAQMSANFERIARTVLERNERAIKDESESNRMTSTTTTTSMPWSNNNETSPSSLVQSSQGSTYATSPEHSAGPSVDMPHTGGLPHNISSSVDNEFLPDAYQGMTTADLTNTNTSPSYTTTAANTATATNAAAASSLPRIYNTNDNLFPTATTATTPTNDLFPFSGFENNIVPPPPSLWQIPLTADWEFGNEFLEGIFANTNTTTNPYPLDFSVPPPPPPQPSHPPQSYPPVSALNPATNPTITTTTPTPPTLDNISIMGSDYGHQNQDQHMAQARAQSQARIQEQMVEANMAFFGGFLNSY